MKFLIALHVVILSSVLLPADCKHLLIFKNELKNHSNLNLSRAVVGLVTSSFENRAKSTNLIIVEQFVNHAVNDFKFDLLSRLGSKIAVRQLMSNHINSTSFPSRRCNILIIETFKDFLEISTKISRKTFRLNSRHLIVLVKGEIPELSALFDILWNKKTYNVNVMFEDESEAISVKTFMPFHNQNCSNTAPVLINKFLNGKFMHENIYPDKTKNLHKCPIRIAVTNTTGPFVIAERLANGSYSFTGEDISMIKVLSETLNFTVHYTFIGPQGYLYENGSSVGPFNALLSDVADLTINNWWLKASRVKFLDASVAYTSEKFIFVVPPGQSPTTFEKLIFPFTSPVWRMIALCFIIGFVITFMIKLHSKYAQSFVFGVDVQSPNLNIFIAFIGQTQNMLPKTNFARFLLMMFLLYSLVIRTLYQGSFYNMMQSEKRNKEFQSVEEIIKNDFYFYSTSLNIDVFQGAEATKNR